MNYAIALMKATDTNIRIINKSIYALNWSRFKSSNRRFKKTKEVDFYQYEGCISMRMFWNKKQALKDKYGRLDNG